MKSPYRPFVVLAAAAALAVGLAGCSSDDASDEAGDICVQLEDISKFERETQSPLSAENIDWADMQAVFEKYNEGLSELYDPAIETANDEVAADLTTLRDASAEVTSLAAEAASVEDLQSKAAEMGVDELLVAGNEATLRIDEYAQANCEFAKQQQQPQPQPQPEEAPQQAPPVG